jgi:hypothetical protein
MRPLFSVGGVSMATGMWNFGDCFHGSTAQVCCWLTKIGGMTSRTYQNNVLQLRCLALCMHRAVDTIIQVALHH